MKALSLSRPWTELITAGIKDVENRSWGTRHRGWLVIHGAKSYDDAALRVTNELAHDGMLTSEDYGALDACAMHPGAPTGFLGIVRVTDCHRWDDLECALRAPNVGFCSPWGFDGSWHWRVEDAHRFPEPLEGRGRQGLFDVPDDVSARIAAVCGGILAT